MTEQLRERLYELLPRLYRQRDAAQGQPLRALMAVLDAEFDTLEGDMVALYDNWFIETADDWVLPYLADLVAAGPLGDGEKWHYTERRRIANTIAYRRRQGTVATLENVVHDITGWSARVVEDSRGVAATQHVADPRPQRGRLVDVSDQLAIGRLHGPFNTVAHTAEIPRRSQSPELHWPATGSPTRQYFPQGTTIFLWRLRPYPMTQATPFRKRTITTETGLRAGCFTFDPLGIDRQLFHVPETLEAIDVEVAAEHIPAPLTRALLAADLASHRPGAVDPELESQSGRNNTPSATATMHYGPGRSLHIEWIERVAGVDQVARGLGEMRPCHVPIPSASVISDDLSSWPDASALAELHARLPDVRAVVDVELGRFVVLEDATTRVGHLESLRVDYAYGFSDDIGGGPYGRGFEFPAGAMRVWRVSQRLAASTMEQERSDHVPRVICDLDQALTEWNEHVTQITRRHADEREFPGHESAPREVSGQIQLLDNAVYEINTNLVKMPPGANLMIAAADEMRPTLRLKQTLVVDTTCAEHPDHDVDPDMAGLERERSEALHAPTRLELQGLLVEGSLKAKAETGAHSGVLDVVIGHCTLVPARTASFSANAGVGRLSISDSILGRLELNCSLNMEVYQSIIDARGRHVAIGSDGGASSPPTVDLDCVTLFGGVRGIRLGRAENVLVAGRVTRSVQRQMHADATIRDAGDKSWGPWRYCHMPPDEDGDHELLSAFTSIRYGEPGYGQLGMHCPDSIRFAGEQGSQPGAFHRAYRPQRLSGLQRIINEFAPLGLEMRIAFVT